MNRNDVIQVDALKTELSGAFRQFEQRMTGVVGELVYAVDTVIERYNALDERHTALETRHNALEAKFDVVSERLLALERLRGEH